MRGAAVLCPRRSGRIRTLLCLRMSGAGVAFPVRFFSVHFLCDALLCTSSPKHYLALLLQGAALPFSSDAMLCPSSPRHCPAFHFRCVAQRIQRIAGASIAAAMRLTAYPSRCLTLRFLSEAFHCFALPHFAFAKQHIANALYCFSTPQPRIARLSDAFPCLGLSVPGFSGAYPLGPLPAPISPW